MCGGVDCDSSSSCQAAGICTDEVDLKPTMTALGVSGNSVCILPYMYQDGLASCLNESQAIPQGCVEPSYNSSYCTQAGGVYYTLATTGMAQCQTTPVSGCFDFNGVFSTKVESDCRACGLEWRPFFIWKTVRRVVALQVKFTSPPDNLFRELGRQV